MATATQSPGASELCSFPCHQEKEKKIFSPWPCDLFLMWQYLIILILLADRACLFSYLSTHRGMPALSFLLAVYFLQSASRWRHLDADQRRCGDGGTRASDPTRSLPWHWLEVREPVVRCHASNRKTGKRRCIPAGAATSLCGCDGNPLHTCTRMNTNRIIAVTAFILKQDIWAVFWKRKPAHDKKKYTASINF